MNEYVYCSDGTPLASAGGEISLPRERVVRCRDCKHYDAYNSLCNKFGIDCYLATPQVNEKPGYEHTYGDYGYCAWGERREQ
jgi:hypothetical protein